MESRRSDKLKELRKSMNRAVWQETNARALRSPRKVMYPRCSLFLSVSYEREKEFITFYDRAYAFIPRLRGRTTREREIAQECAAARTIWIPKLIYIYIPRAQTTTNMCAHRPHASCRWISEGKAREGGMIEERVLLPPAYRGPLAVMSSPHPSFLGSALSLISDRKLLVGNNFSPIRPDLLSMVCFGSFEEMLFTHDVRVVWDSQFYGESW